MREYEVEVKAYGFAPSKELVVAVGDAFEGRELFIDPVISGDLRSGSLELSVEVRAVSERAAHELAAQALGEALVAVGAVEGWTKAPHGQAVIS